MSTILPGLRFSINKNLAAHDSETSVSILLEDPLLDWYTGEAKWPQPKTSHLYRDNAPVATGNHQANNWVGWPRMYIKNKGFLYGERPGGTADNSNR